MELTKEIKTIVSLEIVTICGVSLFWISFALLGIIPEKAIDIRVAYLHIYPFPDLILLILLSFSARFLRKGNPNAKRLAYLSSVGLILLGITNPGVEYTSTIYVASITRVFSNGFVNLWFIVFGFYIFLKIRKR